MSGTTRTAKIDPGDVEKRYKRLYAPHVDSFNWFLDVGARRVIEDLDAITVTLPDGDKCNSTRISLSPIKSSLPIISTVWVEEVHFNTPYRLTPEERLKPSEVLIAQIPDYCK